MNDDEIIALGELSKALLVSEHFHTIIEHYKQSLACDILTTKPADKDKREEIYASLAGVNGLLGYMQLNAAAADKIQNPTPVTTDADLRDTDEEDFDY